MLKTINASLELMHMMPVADQEKYRQKRYDSWQPFCWSLFLFLFVTLVNISLNFICQISSFYFLLILISPLDTPQNMINPVCSRRVAHLKRFRVNGFLKYYFQCTKKCSASSCAEGGVTCFVLFCFLCQSFKHTKFHFFFYMLIYY